MPGDLQLALDRRPWSSGTTNSLSVASGHAERGGHSRSPRSKRRRCRRNTGRCWRRYPRGARGGRAGAVGVGRRGDRRQHRDLRRRRPHHRARGAYRTADFCCVAVVQTAREGGVTLHGVHRVVYGKALPVTVIVLPLPLATVAGAIVTLGVAIPIDPSRHNQSSCSAVAPRAHEARPIGTAT